MRQADRMLTLDEAMRTLADLSVNGRTWSQCLTFLDLKHAVMRELGWDLDEFGRQLDAVVAVAYPQLVKPEAPPPP